MHKSPFNIYNASAGSGKTFTLVKEYLKILLSDTNSSSFQQILAVTFTNKAVNEMKKRVLDSLTELSRIDDQSQVSELAMQLVEELGTELPELKLRSARILQRILHNYAYFEISTIDKFTHRVIRSFARDLRISQNFEVVLDTDQLLEEAVNTLLAKAGENPSLTKVLIDFALEKTDSDKHWDIGLDLMKAGKMLFSENEIPHLNAIRSKELAEFKALQKILKEEITSIENKLISIAENALNSIDNSGLAETDFPNKTLPRHFKRIHQLQLDLKSLYDNQLEEKLKTGNVVKKSVPPPEAEFIEQILMYYLSAKSLIFKRDYISNAYNNILPLTVLNAVMNEVKSIEEERDLLPISSFNSLISNTIVNQPAPFIYERLGEKFRHYFIDEFQDTSQMQWHNLIPLVGNALEGLDESGEPGTLMLVGDVKQAIYRWRGGMPEQFLELLRKKRNPFTISPEIHQLQTNFRSRSEIILFNNNFFSAISSFLGDSSYQSLFRDETSQRTHKKKGGLVQIEFLDKAVDDLEEQYVNKAVACVELAIKEGYTYSDICILTRKKKQGVLISQALASGRIPVSSSETLLLSSNREVLFLIELLKLSLNPADRNTAFNLFSFLIPNNSNFHRQMTVALQDPANHLLEQWQLDLSSFSFRSVYDSLEDAIKKFDLAGSSDAFITYLLDEVLSLEQRFETGVHDFLDYWETNKAKLSIAAPVNLEAVKIMTIHKAKGLEFPIVIFPFANADIYEEIDPKLWVQTDPKQFGGFSELLINKKKSLLNYGKDIETLYMEDVHQKELDAFNVLYVALTRAVDALYIITEKDINSAGLPNTNKYSGLFIHYLMNCGLWEADKQTYSFGNLPASSADKSLKPAQDRIVYSLTSKSEIIKQLSIRTTAIWNTKRADAIEKGNLIHHIMSLVKDVSGIDAVFDHLVESGAIKSEDRVELQSVVAQIVSQPELESYYSDGILAKNEQEIITKNGLILRPDRLVFEENNVVIIDYKTGNPKIGDRDQVRSYGAALEEMGFHLDKGILIYINDTIKTEFI